MYKVCPPEVVRLLDQEGAKASGGVLRFKNVQLPLLEQLSELGVLDPTEAQNSGPEIQELMAMGKRYNGVLYGGYRVADGRWDRRITLDDIRIPLKDVMWIPAELIPWIRSATVVEAVNGFLHLWWD